jgi:hypothetical protein
VTGVQTCALPICLTAIKKECVDKKLKQIIKNQIFLLKRYKKPKKHRKKGGMLKKKCKKMKKRYKKQGVY